jgi:hypothetical protein
MSSYCNTTNWLIFEVSFSFSWFQWKVFFMFKFLNIRFAFRVFVRKNWDLVYIIVGWKSNLCKTVTFLYLLICLPFESLYVLYWKLLLQSSDLWCYSIYILSLHYICFFFFSFVVLCSNSEPCSTAWAIPRAYRCVAYKSMSWPLVLNVIKLSWSSNLIFVLFFSLFLFF